MSSASREWGEFIAPPSGADEMANRRLIQAVVHIAEHFQELAGRRLACLEVLAEQTQAVAGMWAWGMGKALSSTVAPVAVLDFGMSDPQRTILFQMAMNPRTDTEFRDPILNRMGSQEQSTNLVDHVFPTIEAWETSYFRQELLRMGMEFWLHSVRYSHLDSWSTLLLFRSVGSERFTMDQRDFIHLAMASINWLQPPIFDAVRSDSALSLTHRQRTVLFLLLDGQSRKQIAKSLGICEETVGDHLKVIYREFGVHSAGELAALFLRSH